MERKIQSFIFQPIHCSFSGEGGCKRQKERQRGVQGEWSPGDERAKAEKLRFDFRNRTQDSGRQVTALSLFRLGKQRVFAVLHGLPRKQDCLEDVFYSWWSWFEVNFYFYVHVNSHF